MISKDYEALRGLLEEFRREAAQLDAQIDDTARKIREAEAFLAVYTDSQPDDIRVFSPRKAEILYKEEIRQKEKEKSVYEERRGELSQKRETLEGRMTALQDVLSRQRKNVSSRAEGRRSNMRLRWKSWAAWRKKSYRAAHGLNGTLSRPGRTLPSSQGG